MHFDAISRDATSPSRLKPDEMHRVGEHGGLVTPTCERAACAALREVKLRVAQGFPRLDPDPLMLLLELPVLLLPRPDACWPDDVPDCDCWPDEPLIWLLS